MLPVTFWYPNGVKNRVNGAATGADPDIMGQWYGCPFFIGL